jgi:Uma2 family endonuclease
MTTTKTQLPPMRPFTPEECEALVSAEIIADGEQSDVMAGTRPFTADECLGMVNAGILHKDDRLELIDGKIVVMAPIGEYHHAGTDWLNLLLVPALLGRAMVRVGGSIFLSERSAPQPDIAVIRLHPITDLVRIDPPEVYFLIEVADSSLSYDTGAKLARYAAAGIPEVWVANLRVRQVTVHADPSGMEYATFRTYRAGDSISPSAFPDVMLALDDFMPPASRGCDA